MYRRYGEIARIGRFTWNIFSPDFGKYYVDIQTPFGGKNNSDIPKTFPTFEKAEEFLLEIGFNPT